MNTVCIEKRIIGDGYPCFVIAEISANHNQDFEKAKRLVAIAKDCGADAVKLQTYLPDTITLNCKNEYFAIKEGAWSGQYLYDLYKKAFTPWEWQVDLMKYAKEVGLITFSTPFDTSAVEFLEKTGVPAYKVASFEIVDKPLLECIAAKKKPVLISTGMASLAEIEEAVSTVRSCGNDQIVLLKCMSDYPADPAEMNLKTICSLRDVFGLPVGFSDHSMHSEMAIAALSLGACVIEKHFIEDRTDGGPDAHFSLEPKELKELISMIRRTEGALGCTSFAPTKGEQKNKIFRKSLFISKDICKGEIFSKENIRSVRPGFGLSPKYFSKVIGKKSLCNIPFGTPLKASMVDEIEI